MRFKDFLKESEEKHAVFAFGRMNPPTIGHEHLVNKVHEIAKQHNASHHVVLSHSQDKKKNPLSAEQKKTHAKRFFPKTNISVASKEKPTLLHHLSDLHKKGVTHLHMVAGSDRIPEYHKLIHAYNGKHGPHGHFHFKHVEMHSAGERDPDAEGVSGMSASKMRDHASKGNYKEFRKGVPSHVSDEHAKELYHHVRHGMNINEELNKTFIEFITEGVHDQGIFKAVFLGGGPGSGKDYVLSNTLDGHGLTEINSDKALEYLMDKEKLDKTMPDNEEAQRNAVRKRAKNTTELRQKLAIHGRNGLIINGTADDPKKIAELKKRLEKLGYETKMVMVNTRDEVSQARNIERGQRGGRTVPENIRKEKWDSVQAARPELAKMFGAHYTEFDNSEDLRNADPETVKAKKEEMMGIFKNVREFVTKPSENESAQTWIAKQLQKKDTLPVPKAGAAKLPHPNSAASEEASRLGLQYYGFGRYGKNGEVTHRSVHDQLVPVTKSVNESFESFLNESVSITITGDTPEEIKQTLKLLKNDDSEEVRENAYELSDSSPMKVLMLGKQIKEDKQNAKILTESIQEERSSTGSQRRTNSIRTESRDSCSCTDSSGTDTGRKITGKITIQQIRDRAKEKKLQKESIDKGIEPGLSMAASGESPDRDTGEKNKKKTGKATQVAETVGGAGEMATSMSAQKEDELKKQGISLKSWRAKRPIG